jgi:hypothetical protein
MKKYIGVKIVGAKEATLNEYRMYRINKYGEKATIDEEGDKKLGYIVYYPGIGEDKELYVSWSPKDVFEKRYTEIDEEEVKLINYDMI